MINLKQRITPEQLAELSDEQRERLRDWWKPQAGGFVVINWKQDYIGMFLVIHVYPEHVLVGGMADEVKFEKDKVLPLLSIGQMVELLSQRRPVDISFLTNEKTWDVMVLNDYSPKGEEGAYWGDGPDWERDELVDALWEAVKEVL